MSGVKLVATPLTLSIHLSVSSTTLSEFDKECMTRVPYTNAVGSLMCVR